jgi:hypothetical protein
MIRNARRYRIPQAQIAKLKQACARLSAGEEGASDVHSRLRQAEYDVLPSQMDELREHLAASDALRTRKRLVLRLTSCEKFSQALIQACIATGMRQQALARC